MLFLPHGRVRPRAAVYFLAYPIAYSIFIALRAQFGGYLYGTVRYPYPFADPDLLGWPVTLLVAALLLLVCYGPHVHRPGLLDDHEKRKFSVGKTVNVYRGRAFKPFVMNGQATTIN